MSRKTRSVVPAAMAAVLVVAAASVGAADIDIAEVRIHASEQGTDARLGWINPGDTLVLPPRTEVKLWIEAVPENLGGRYPGAEYEVTHGTVTVSDREGVVVRTRGADRQRVVGIKNAKPEQGAVVLETFDREGESVVRYTLLDTIKGLDIPKHLRSSAFTVRVDDDAELVPVGDEPVEPIGLDDAHEAVDHLYQGILLREPGPEGHAAYGELIRDGGWAGTIDAALQIARSEESRVAVYQRGVSYEQRLSALYEHLLGIEPSAVDRDQWREDLETLRAGNLDRLVEDMAQSDTFRERFGFRVSLRRFAVPR